MIKNILYSLFLHVILVFFLYINFRIIKNEIIEVDRGISVGLINFQKDKITAPITEEIKIPEKEIEKKSEKKAPNKKTKKEKLAKKPKITKKIQEKSEGKKADLKKGKEKPKEETLQEEKTEKSPETEAKEELKSEIQDKPKIYKNQEITDDLEQINLSAREKFNIKTQLAGCFTRIIKDKPKTGINTVIKINVNLDGTIIFDFEKMVDVKRYEDETQKSYKISIDNIIQALELCSPLRNLPPEKYDVWQEFSIRFTQ